MRAKPVGQIYQIKATLRYSRPPIWRRLLVESHTSLTKFHFFLQVAFGWTNSHLHEWEVGNTHYQQSHLYDSNDDFGSWFDDDDLQLDDARRAMIEKYRIIRKNERGYYLDTIGLQEKSKWLYTYDFGDNWQVQLLLEKILPPKAGQTYPVCIKAKRAGPLDDSGGIWGFEGMVDGYNDPMDDNYEQAQEWLGPGFDPAVVDIELMNKRLFWVNRLDIARLGGRLARRWWGNDQRE